MKKTRFTETQIVRSLKEGEVGGKTHDISRELEISKAIFITGKVLIVACRHQMSSA